MALDGLTLSYLRDELSSCIGARVEKVHQPAREELVLVLRDRKGQKKLLLSARANSPKVHFTSFPPENPAKPPMLCMLLRKHLTGATVRSLRTEGLERALFIDFDATDEIGDPVELTLCIEIMAQHSNIILINGEGIILDAVKRVDSEKSSLRQILPGMLYKIPPKQDKPDLDIASPEQIAELMAEKHGKNLSLALLHSVQGLSPIVCREAVCRAVGDDKRVELCDDAEILKVAETAIAFKDFRPIPCAVSNEAGEPLDFTFFVPLQYGSVAKTKIFGSFSELLDDFYYDRDRLDRARQNSLELTKTVNNLISRTARKIDLQKHELEQCADREKLRINAELIAANVYRLHKGSPFYEVENYYDNNAVIRINADPSLSPNANSQRYYKEYRKAKTAEQMLTGLIVKGEDELAYLESVADMLSRAETAAQIAEIKAELTHTGFIKAKSKAGKQQLKPVKPDEYVSSDGFRILVGKNNEMNDRLSLKTASKSDIWLHTQKIPGSHVIIETIGRDVPETTLTEAAIIAAYNSRAAQSSGVPVDYTNVKNLKKPVGAKPGKVIYHVYNTIYVTPDRDKVLSLKK